MFAPPFDHRWWRIPASLAGVALVTWIGWSLALVNAPTVGFGFLLLVLLIASYWGFTEALVTSIIATLAFNFYFLPPVGTFTIADPQNWVALFSFLLTSVVASRLSDKVKRRAMEAIERQRDLERLYSFSHAILLIDDRLSLTRQLAARLADIFEFRAVVLYDRRSDECSRAGSQEFSGSMDRFRESAMNGTFFSEDADGEWQVITAVRLGRDPIGSLGVQGARRQDSVLQGIANLVAIGLERAHASELASQVEAARRSDELRSSIIDAIGARVQDPADCHPGGYDVVAGNGRPATGTAPGTGAGGGGGGQAPAGPD